MTAPQALPLAARTLPELAARLPVPTYDRTRVRAGIVHFGVGGFHRAHQAMYLDRLMTDGKALDWGICGVGVLPSDEKMKDALAAQDGLFTLVVKHPDGMYEPRVIGSIVQYLYAPDDPDTVIDKLVEPDTRIVSLTVTEGGYNIDSITGEFLRNAPDVVADLRPGVPPRSVFGLVTEALVRRRAAGTPPFTVMSCDNIAGNGGIARRAFSAFASLRDPELGAWVRDNVCFPDSMVDRITPVTTDDDRHEVARRFGVNDRWPVVCEPFTQWVLQDDFALGRPPLEDLGVQLVEDVEPYELMKLRLLNGSHQALCYLGHLAGYRLVHDVATDPLFAEFLRAYMDREATPTLAPVPGVDLAAYKDQLLDRFSNPQVRDTVARLCAESSDRIPKWLLPVLRSQIKHDGEIDRTVLVLASWARYAEGSDEQGEPIVVVDRLREQLTEAALSWPDDPLAFLRQDDLFGELAGDPRVSAAYTAALQSLHERGARATLAALVART